MTDWLAYDTGYTERYLGVPPVDLKVWTVLWQELVSSVISLTSPTDIMYLVLQASYTL